MLLLNRGSGGESTGALIWLSAHARAKNILGHFEMYGTFLTWRQIDEHEYPWDKRRRKTLNCKINQDMLRTVQFLKSKTLYSRHSTAGLKYQSQWTKCTDKETCYIVCVNVRDSLSGCFDTSIAKLCYTSSFSFKIKKYLATLDIQLLRYDTADMTLPHVRPKHLMLFNVRHFKFQHCCQLSLIASCCHFYVWMLHTIIIWR